MTEPGWVLTCDPGTDDAIALAVAAGHPGCRVAAIVAGAGNVDAFTAWRNATGMARLLGLDVPVGLGDPLTLDGTAIARPGGIHGTDGLAGLAHLLPEIADVPDVPGGKTGAGRAGVHDRRDVPDVPGGKTGAGRAGVHDRRVVPDGPGSPGIPGRQDVPVGPALPGTSSGPDPQGPPSRRDRPDSPGGPASQDLPGATTLVQGAVIALGPLSDVARTRRTGQPIGPLVWMGGTAAGGMEAGGAPGEFNAGVDPAATDELLATVEDMAVVPIDVTRLVTFGAADIDRWATVGGPGARLCAALARARLHGGTATLHDPVAVVAALDPHLFTWERVRLRCAAPGGGHPPGTLVPAPEQTRRATVRLAVAVDITAVRGRITDAVLHT